MIFLAFFSFSFIIFLTGIWQKSFIFSLSGSLLLIILSIILVGVGIQHTEIKNIVLNVSGSVETYRATVSTGLNDVMTHSLGLLLGIFSSFFLLYSVWQYVTVRRMAK